jgi:hypothetical protein
MDGAKHEEITTGDRGDAESMLKRRPGSKIVLEALRSSDERFWIGVVLDEIRVYGGLQIGSRTEESVADALERVILEKKPRPR